MPTYSSWPSCGTLVNMPRRSRSVVRSRKKRSTMPQRRRGRREVHVKGGCSQSCYHRVLVRGVVVGDQVQRFVLGCLAVDLLSGTSTTRVGVALLALAMTAIEHVGAPQTMWSPWRQSCVIVARPFLAVPVACDRAPAPGSSRRSTAPGQLRRGRRSPRCLRSFWANWGSRMRMVRMAHHGAGATPAA